MEESAERVAREKAVYDILRNRRHPNILRCILHIPQGLFLERMETTLQVLIEGGSCGSADTQVRWVGQLASAVAWLETLGYAHGDLRPVNVLLTAKGDVRLADFDASVRVGEPLLVASEPFCRLGPGFELPNARPLSEQFALASKLINGEFPAIVQDVLFGVVTLGCWRGEYVSLDAVDQVIRFRTDAGTGSAAGDETHGRLLAECDEFLSAQRTIRTDARCVM